MKQKILLLLFFVISAAASAQFSNTKWKAILKPHDPVAILFSFGTDTLILSKADDGSFIESMFYNATDDIMTLKKITGQSECDTLVIARYRFVKKDNTVYLTAIADDCAHRLGVLDKVELNKQ
jgi:hypothetical protein